MKVVISNRDKYIRKEVVRNLIGQYPNCVTESYEDSMLAAKAVYNEPADVIIIGAAGLKLIPMLRKKDDKLKIVILADNNNHRDNAFSVGADAYITLPLSSDELFSAVEGTIEKDYI